MSVTAAKVSLITADIAASNPSLAELAVSPTIGPIIEAVIAEALQAFTGCLIAPPAAVAMMKQQTGILGRLHKARLRSIVSEAMRSLLKDRGLRVQLLDPITDSTFKQGPNTTEEDVVAMNAEALSA